MNTSKQAYASDKIMYSFVEECGGSEIHAQTMEELSKLYDSYRNSLGEYDCLIQHFQDIGNTEEVAFLRRQLQHAKMVMREIKKKIMDANKNISKEIAYS